MERTYVFNQEPSSGGGNKFDIMAMLPNLMGGKGVDPNLMALLSQGRNNQDQWGGSWWFIWIILLWFCWGGNGYLNNRWGACLVVRAGSLFYFPFVSRPHSIAL